MEVFITKPSICSNTNPPGLCDTSRLVPIINRPPFDCNILPPPYNEQCWAKQRQYPDNVKSDCSALPVSYRPFCNALPPPDTVNPNGVTNIQSWNPDVWPNSAAVRPYGPESFSHARQVCSALGPREFYACLWQKTKYPPYPEMFQDAMISDSNYQCSLRNPDNVWPCPDRWHQKTSNQTGNCPNTPQVWGM